MKTFYERLIFITISLFVISAIVISMFWILERGIEETERKIEECKSLGYDGVKSLSSWNNEIECSNFTESEREERRLNPEIRNKEKQEAEAIKAVLSSFGRTENKNGN